MAVNDLQVGCTVHFTKGKNKDNNGTVKKLTPKQVVVLLSHNITIDGRNEVRVPKTSVEVLEPKEHTHEEEEEEDEPPITEPKVVQRSTRLKEAPAASRSSLRKTRKVKEDTKKEFMQQPDFTFSYVHTYAEEKKEYDHEKEEKEEPDFVWSDYQQYPNNSEGLDERMEIEEDEAVQPDYATSSNSISNDEHFFSTTTGVDESEEEKKESMHSSEHDMSDVQTNNESFFSAQTGLDESKEERRKQKSKIPNNIPSNDFSKRKTSSKCGSVESKNGNLRCGCSVNITQGKYKGNKGVVKRLTAKQVVVQFDDDAIVDGKNEVRISQNSVRSSESHDHHHPDEKSNDYNPKSEDVTKKRVSPWCLDKVDEKDQLHVVGRSVETVVLGGRPGSTKSQKSFLDYWLDGRILNIEIELKKGDNSDDLPLERSFQLEGRTYELISSKVDDNGFESWGGRKYCIRLVYVAVSGRGLRTICLEKELDKIANFSALTPRKAVARLELLQSPSAKDMVFDTLDSTDFGEISENGHIGCGFIPDGMISELMGNTAKAKRTFALQVRIICPKLGIFKGMLMSKPGISKIQLPLSMKKVGPSLCEDASDKAFMLVTSAGVHQNKTNWMVGRKLGRGKPPPDSFEPKKLSDMILRLLRSHGIPSELTKSYQLKSKAVAGLNHAFVVGVADPTGMLPEGHIFITGMGSEHGKRDDLFVSRVPCMEPSDGWRLPVICNKPTNMSQSDWDWLNELGFGAVIFGNPKTGSKPLPEIIANGDLYGDLYFICWDDDILINLPTIRPPRSTDTKPSKGFVASLGEEKWLSRAQDIMVAISTLKDLRALIGKCYTISCKLADKSPDFLHDKNARIFAQAYKDGIDIAKHGHKLSIPHHLREELPQKFHCFLSDMVETDICGSKACSETFSSHTDCDESSVDSECSDTASSRETRDG